MVYASAWQITREVVGEGVCLSGDCWFQRLLRLQGSSLSIRIWYFMVLFFALYLVVAIIDELFLSATLNLRNLPLGHYLPLGFVDPEVGLLVLLYRPVMALPTLAATVRRLHDVGKSGWWSALWVLPVPVLGWFYLVPLLSRPSQD